MRKNIQCFNKKLVIERKGNCINTWVIWLIHKTPLISYSLYLFSYWGLEMELKRRKMGNSYEWTSSLMFSDLLFSSGKKINILSCELNWAEHCDDIELTRLMRTHYMNVPCLLIPKGSCFSSPTFSDLSWK